MNVKPNLVHETCSARQFIEKAVYKIVQKTKGGNSITLFIMKKEIKNGIYPNNQNSLIRKRFKSGGSLRNCEIFTGGLKM